MNVERDRFTRPALKRPCVFFDRDGVVNCSPGPGYVTREEDFHLLAGFVEALRVVQDRGHEAVIVTNQRGIALGAVSRQTVDRIHSALRAHLREEGLRLLDIMVCPHDNGQCTCRKPLPGMLLEAARRHDLDLARSWMVGDSERDVQAGRAAGCRTILIGEPGGDSEADVRLADLSELGDFLRRTLPAPGD